MTDVTCVRCGEPIAFGQPYSLISDGHGNHTYMHLLRVAGDLVESCPQPDPVAESGEEEEPATEGSASPQVNMSADLPSAAERTAGETLSTDRAARSVVGAPPSFDLEARLRLVSEAAEDGFSAMVAADEILYEFARLRRAMSGAEMLCARATACGALLRAALGENHQA